MKSIRFSVLLLSALTLTAAALAAPHEITVARVIDGDSLRLSTGAEVRLIGVDCPEYNNAYRNDVNARKLEVNPVVFEGYAAKSRVFAGETVKGKPVTIEHDPINAERSHKDSYGRTLAYVLVDGQNLSALLIKEGYCFAYRRFDFKYRDEFLAYEAEAKAQKKGFWAHPRRARDRDDPRYLIPKRHAVVFK